MRERRKVDPRVLQLKIRLRAPRGYPADALLADVQEAAETGLSPAWAASLPAVKRWKAGEWVGWIDWRKGEGAFANSGTLTEETRKELRAFWGALTYPTTRLKIGRAE